MPTPRAIVTLCACGLLFACEDKQPPPPRPAIPAPSRTTTPPPAPPAAQSGAPMPQPMTGAPAPTGGPTINALNLSFTVPAGWQSSPPSNQMRLAEIHIPDASGDAGKACLIVFATAMGTVDENIGRWGTQVHGPDGQPAKPDVQDRTVAGMPAKTVELHGSFQNMGESTPHENWVMRGAIIQTPQGLLFVKMTGPADQMAAQAGAFKTMLDGAKVP